MLQTQALRTILIVEDYADDARSLESLFHELGILNPVRIVQTAIDAIAYLNGSIPYADRTLYPLPGIILLDLKLPGLDGFEFLEWLKPRPEFDDTLVVAISGLDNLASIRQAYALGADSFLAKPCRAADLDNLIQWFPAYWLRATAALSAAERTGAKVQ